MILRVVATTAAGLVALVASLHAAGVSRQEADALSRKITLIAEHGTTARPGSEGRASAVARRTTVSEGELNSWFAYKGAPFLPAGVTKPTVTIIGNGTMKGTAVVDLDAVSRRRNALDPLSFLGGQLPIAVTGTLDTKEGLGRFEVQAAEIGGVPVPAALVEEVISYYTRSSEYSDRVRFGEAFSLPANIRQIEVGRGQMIVVQ